MKYNKHPQCYKRGSHNMVIKRVLVTIEGESEEEGKKKKEGEGEDNITEQLKGFWSP